MELNILDQNVVRLIIADINSQQNLERKRNEWIAYQSTQGMLKDYVNTRLQVLFPKNARKMRVSDISISKKVIDKLANAYCEKPIRQLEDASEEQNQELHSIYKRVNLILLFKTLMKYLIYIDTDFSG
jgi:hypothetical protein